MAFDQATWARSWGQLLCLGVCVVTAAARQIVPELEEHGYARLLRWAMTMTAAALAAQLASVPGKEEHSHEENHDSSLAWREDEGRSKLVPVLPGSPQVEQKSWKRFTMAEVAQHCTRDDLWIIVDGRAYDITGYVDKHPGGALPMENMAGKDCTDVFANYHAARVYKHMLPAFLVGEVSDYTVYPHVADFRAVRQELLQRGLFETSKRYYAKMCTFFLALLCVALWLSLGCVSTTARMCGAAVMGIFWQQLAGLGHDLGHSGVTHVFWLDHMIGSLLAFPMGISTSWWKHNHNTHHVVCNSVEHDPDIQHMPIFAVTPRIFEKPFWSTFHLKWVSMDAVTRFLICNQVYLYYPVMMLARFNLYAQSWIHLLSNRRMYWRRLEICSMLGYAIWVSTVALSMPTWAETIGWLVVSHAVSGILHVQIGISHWSMGTYHGHAYNDDKDEWYITQLKTTMNVATEPWLDWVHIGLQFQIEHHLYPRLPRHNLRKARELVKAVCEKHNIHYHEPSFCQANVEILSAMLATSRSARSATKGSSGFYESALWDGMNLNG